MSSRLLAISLSAVLTALLTFQGATAATAPTDNLLKLHQLRLAAQKSLGDFYMFNSMDGDQRYARQIDESVHDASARLAEITNLPGDASKAMRAQLEQQLNAYESELKNLTTAMKTQGFTDLQPVADLATRNQQLMALSSELYTKIQQESGQIVPPMTQQSREQSLLMQAIAVDYASRSASVGGTFIGSAAGDEKTIDDLVNQFAGQLTTMEKAPQNTTQIRESLSGINTKWRYIEKSLKNYNENSVPFVVSKYSDSIIDGLEGVSAQYLAAKL
ncbi:hypothetical protein ACVW0Y_001969 [Pseudomonas sp. TE3786]